MLCRKRGKSIRFGTLFPLFQQMTSEVRDGRLWHNRNVMNHAHTYGIPQTWRICDFMASFTFGCLEISDSVRNDRQLWKMLDLAFSSKETSTHANRELQNSYKDSPLSVTECCHWFCRLKHRGFDVDDCFSEKSPKTFKDAGLEALLEEDPYQTQIEPASTLRVTVQAFSKRFGAWGKNQKQITSDLYDLKQRDIERILFGCEQVISGKNGRGLLIKYLGW